MPAIKELIKYLDSLKLKYEILEHKTVYTALDKAGTLHLEPKMIVKTAVLKMDTKDYALALVPADKLLDKNKIKVLINKKRKQAKLKGFKKIDFAAEAWMKKNLSGQVGATPPFGALWQLDTFVDNSLLKQVKIVVNAGDYNTSVMLTKAAFTKALGQATKGTIGLSVKKKK